MYFFRSFLIHFNIFTFVLWHRSENVSITSITITINQHLCFLKNTIQRLFQARVNKHSFDKRAPSWVITLLNVRRGCGQACVCNMRICMYMQKNICKFYFVMKKCLITVIVSHQVFMQLCLLNSYVYVLVICSVTILLMVLK